MARINSFSFFFVHRGQCSWVTASITARADDTSAWEGALDWVCPMFKLEWCVHALLLLEGLDSGGGKRGLYGWKCWVDEVSSGQHSNLAADEKILDAQLFLSNDLDQVNGGEASCLLPRRACSLACR
jgi:hypothetical protein